MAERVIVVELDIETGDSAQQLDSVKTQLEGIEDEVRNISKASRESDAEKQFEKLNKVVDESVLSIQELGTAADNYKNIAIAAGVTSPIGQEALKKAAALEFEMDQINQSVSQIAGGGKALNNALQLGTGVIAGYTAFQGVTALLGDENEELQETFIKLQAAQSALMGVKELSIALNKQGLIVQTAQTVGTTALTAATVAYNTVVGTSTGLMKVFRLALASTGIGAIVVGVGLLIANFDTLKKGVADLVDWFMGLGTQVVRLIEWYNELGIVGKAIAYVLAAPIVLAIEAYQFFFGEVEQGTADLMELEAKRRKEQREADEELKKQHANRLKEIDELQEAQIKASDERIKALELEKDTLEANGKSSAEVTMQILQEQLSQTQAVLEGNRSRLQSWIDYYMAQAELRGQNAEEYKQSLKEQGVDLDALQDKVEDIITENERAVKFAENAITKFRREQNKQRSKDLEDALSKDIQTQMEYADKSMATWADYQRRFNDIEIDFDDMFGDSFEEEFEFQAEATLSKMQEFMLTLREIFRKGLDAIPQETMAMLQNMADGVDMAMETFSAVNDTLNQLGEQRSEDIARRTDEQVKLLEDAKNKELQKEALTANQRIKIEQDFAMAEYRTRKAAAEAQDKIAEKQFKRDKALRLAEIGIGTASGIIKALAQYGPSPIGIAAMASAAAIGAAQAAAVASTKFEGTASSIQPPSFDTPNITADTNNSSSGGGSNGTGSGNQNDTTTDTDTLINPPPIIISQVEINKVQDGMAKINDVSIIGG